MLKLVESNNTMDERLSVEIHIRDLKKISIAMIRLAGPFFVIEHCL
jgi:hypothetical protein